MNSSLRPPARKKCWGRKQVSLTAGLGKEFVARILTSVKEGFYDVFLHKIVWFGVLFKINSTSNYSKRSNRPESEGRLQVT